jgi:DNA polymerase-3 subunit delta'
MPDVEMETIVQPKDNNYFIGHKEAEDMFLQAWKSNSLHQAWLISGDKGIGKATLAYRLARFLLQADESRRQDYTSLDVSPDSQTFRQIAGGSHPDFKLLERSYLKTERQKIIKANKEGNYLSNAELEGLKKSSVIVVDDVRTINDFLAKKSAGGHWRVVLVDTADDMNDESANALLKRLEEPPHHTLMLLISNAPQRLLPTIRSRCAKIELKPLQDNEVASLLRRYRSALSESDIKKLVGMAGGSIGKAIAYADGDAVSWFERIYRLATAGMNFKTADMLKFSKEATVSDEIYDLVQELIFKFLSEQVRSQNKIEENAELFDKASTTFLATDKLNMDKQQAIMKIMFSICRAYK